VSRIQEAERHADEADQAASIAENFISDSIEHVRRAAQREQERIGKPTGFCMSCDAELFDPTGRFCDIHCGQDWERVQAARARNGREE
jgi:hypothetical protein